MCLTGHLYFKIYQRVSTTFTQWKHFEVKTPAVGTALLVKRSPRSFLICMELSESVVLPCNDIPAWHAVRSLPHLCCVFSSSHTQCWFLSLDSGLEWPQTHVSKQQWKSTWGLLQKDCLFQQTISFHFILSSGGILGSVVDKPWIPADRQNQYTYDRWSQLQGGKRSRWEAIRHLKDWWSGDQFRWRDVTDVDVDRAAWLRDCETQTARVNIGVSNFTHQITHGI